eukprot:1158137-Pelagomonas_calceolata.AAC.10
MQTVSCAQMSTQRTTPPAHNPASTHRIKSSLKPGLLWSATMKGWVGALVDAVFWLPAFSFLPKKPRKKLFPTSCRVLAQPCLHELLVTSTIEEADAPSCVTWSKLTQLDKEINDRAMH